jgi:hypothetical protein
MGIPTSCISPAFTSGPLDTLTLADTRPLDCPWPTGQLDSANALRYDPAHGLWTLPPGLPYPATSTSLLPVQLSTQGGTFSTPVTVPQLVLWTPSTADPAFNVTGGGTTPATACNPVTITNPSHTQSMGFVGWCDFSVSVNPEGSQWMEMWGQVYYPGSQWPNIQSNWDAIASTAPPLSASFLWYPRARRAVVFTIVAPLGTVTVTPRIGVKTVFAPSLGTPQVLSWSWNLWGSSFLLDPIAQG